MEPAGRVVLQTIVVVGVLAALAGCQSYEQEWMNTRQQLLAAEAQIQSLRDEIKVQEEAIVVRDEAIAERDSIIRDQCYARPEPEL